MFQVLKKRIKNEKGLSLVELLAVIVILGIVAAIAIPAIGNIINTSRDKGQVSDALNIIAGGKIAHIETGCGTKTDGCGETVLKSYVDGKKLDGISVKLDDSDWTIDGYTFAFKSDGFKGKESTNTELELKRLLDPDEADTTVTPPGEGGDGN